MTTSVPKISFLLPLYNCRTLLTRSVNSIVAQFDDMHNNEDYYEIIILNDGSTDGSDIEAECLKENIPQIKLYSQPNRGIAYSRQRLLELANGEYIFFVDPDDYIMGNTVVRIVKALDASPKADAAYFSFICANESKVCEAIVGDMKFNEVTMSYFLNNVFDIGHISPVWQFIFRRSSIKASFDTDINYAEDLTFLIEQLSRQCYVLVTSANVYVYCYNSSSLTNKRTSADYISRSEGAVNVAKKVNAFLQQSKHTLPIGFRKRLDNKIAFLSYLAVSQRVIGGGNCRTLLKRLKASNLYPYHRWGRFDNTKQRLLFYALRNRMGLQLFSVFYKICTRNGKNT